MARYRAGTNLVLLDPELSRAFRTEAAVNQALHAASRIGLWSAAAGETAATGEPCEEALNVIGEDCRSGSRKAVGTGKQVYRPRFSRFSPSGLYIRTHFGLDP